MICKSLLIVELKLGTLNLKKNQKWKDCSDQTGS